MAASTRTETPAAGTPRRSLPRRILAGLGWTLLGLAGFLVVLVTTLFFVGRSDWGHRKIISVALPIVRPLLTGDVNIGRLDGDIVHMLVLRDVEIKDAEGQVAARIDSVGLRYNLLALAGRTLHITAVDLKGQVHARFLADGRLNLAALLKPTPPSNGPLPIHIHVSGIDADVTADLDTHLPPSATPLPFARAALHLHAQAEVRMARSRRLQVEVKGLAVDVSAPTEVNLGLRGGVAIAGPAITFQDVALEIHTTGEQVTRLAPAAALRGGLEARVQLSGSLDALAAAVTLKLPAGTIQAELKARPLAPELPWQLDRLEVAGLDPSALRPGLPAAVISLLSRGQGQAASGRFELQRLAVAALDSELQAGGWVEAPPGILQSGDWRAARGELGLQLTAHDLSALRHVGVKGLGGKATAQVKAQLADRKVHLDTTLGGRGLAGGGAHLGAIELTLKAVDLDAQLALKARELRAAEQRFSVLELTGKSSHQAVTLAAAGHGPKDVDFRLVLDGRPEFAARPLPVPHGKQLAKARPAAELSEPPLNGIEALIKELRLSRQGHTLALTGPARIHLDVRDAPIVDVEHLGFALGSLRVKLDGRYDTGPGRVAATLAVRYLDARALAQVVGVGGDVPETAIDVDARVGGTVKAPHGQVRVAGDFGPLARLPLPRMGLRLTAALDGQKVQGELSLHPVARVAGPQVDARFAGGLDRRGPLDVDLKVQAALEQLQPLVPKSAGQIGGNVSLHAAVSGTLPRPEALLHVELPQWKSDWMRGSDTRLAIDYKGERLSVDVGAKLAATTGERLGEVRLSAAEPLQLSTNDKPQVLIDRLLNGTLRLQLALANLDVPRLWHAVLGGESMLTQGRVDVQTDVAGPPLSPTLVMSIDAHDLVYPGRPGHRGQPGLPDQVLRGTAGLRLTYREGKLDADVRSTLDGKPLLKIHAGTDVLVKELLAEGGKLVSRLPLTVALDVVPSELPPVLPVHGRISAHAEVHGTVAAPQVTAALDATGMKVEDWPVGNVKARVSLDQRRQLDAKLDIAQGAGQPGSIRLAATVPLPVNLKSRDLQVSLAAQGYRLDYEAPTTLPENPPVLLARGTLDADLKLRGGDSEPLPTGFLRLADGQFAATALPELFRDLALDLAIEPGGVIRLRKLHALSDNGHADITGGARLAGMVLQKLGLKVSAANFPIAAGPLGVWLDSEIDINGETVGDTLRTRIRVAQGSLRLPKLSTERSVQPLGPLQDVKLVDPAARREQEKAAAAEAKSAKAGAAASGLPRRTVIQAQIAESFAVVGPEVKTRLTGHVDVELDAPKLVPIVTGEIHTEGGWLEIMDGRYQIERAQVSMGGGVPVNPLLNVRVSRQIGDVLVYIAVTGSAKKPRINFTSDPPTYDESQLIALIISGGHKSGGSLQQKAFGALSSLLVGQLKQQLGDLIPVDEIRLNAGGTDATGMNQSSLEVGKYIRDDLYLLYTHRFGVPFNVLRRYNNDELTVEWRFRPNYEIDVMGGDQGVGALNFYWTKHF